MNHRHPGTGGGGERYEKRPEPDAAKRTTPTAARPPSSTAEIHDLGVAPGRPRSRAGTQLMAEHA